MKFKQLEAEKSHNCDSCDKKIEPGENYYKSYEENKHLDWLHSKEICENCYENDSYKNESKLESQRNLEDFN